jgi:hypothetical protein
VTFGGLTWKLVSQLSAIKNHDANLAVIDFTGTKSYGDLRVVMVQNLFTHPISLYFDDSEAGTFLTTIQEQEKSKLRVGDGYVLYCTSEDSMDSLAAVTIRNELDMYYLQPSFKYPKPRNEDVIYKVIRFLMKNYVYIIVTDDKDLR